MIANFSHSIGIALLLFFNALQARAQENSTLYLATQSNNLVIQDINTRGIVRGCNLSNLEALLNILANGFEIAGILIGCIIMLKLLKPLDRQNRFRIACTALLFVAGGLLTPASVNWVISAARAANLFS